MFSGSNGWQRRKGGYLDGTASGFYQGTFSVEVAQLP